MRRFGLHLAAAIGAVGVFAAAAVVGASQTHQASDVVAQPVTSVVQSRPVATPLARGRAAAGAVRPERSLAGTIQSVGADSLQVVGVGGRTWTIEPVAGALIRLNGKAARLEGLQAGDTVVILGQRQAGPGLRFVAHAVTAKRK